MSQIAQERALGATVNQREIIVKKTNAITAILFFLGMLIFIFFNWLPIWSSAMASLFISVSIRQFLIGKIVDIFISMIFFALLFVTNSFYYSEFWTGILLMAGAGYIFIRQCFDLYSYHKQTPKEIHCNVNEDNSGLNSDDPKD